MDSTQETSTELRFDFSARAREQPKTATVQSINQPRHSNDAAMINRLPAELLLFIFESILGRGDYQGQALSYYRRLHSLSSVCACWFSIIERSPQLWTTVAWGLTKEGFRKVLERSSSRLIDIEFDPAPPQARQDQTLQDPFKDFLDTLGPAIERLRTLKLAPRRFFFINDPAWWNMENVELFDGNCPNLRDIQVVGADCKWSQAAFKGLESLQLTLVTFYSIRSIVDILRESPQLKRLEIRDCEVQDNVPSDTEPVSLPNLQSLCIELENEYGLIAATEQLLEHISAPPQCSLYISLAYIDEELEFLINAFCDWLFGRQAEAVLEDVDGFKLGYTASTDILSCSADFELLSGSASIKGGTTGSMPKDTEYVLEYIRGLFQQSTATETFTTLRLSGGAVELLNDSQVFTPLKEFPSITRLELVGPQRSSRDLQSGDVSGSSAVQAVSLFSTIKTIILRQVLPDDIMAILLDSMSKCQVEYLDLVEIHVEGEDFDKAGAVVEALRTNPVIGKVDLYVTL
ncbi:hypothetical protein FS837_009069 [Tulasnella sp. UAMH 9824]|nr:hypothetical protein FS837_009069 [Tulasnella sp. UAMH 9824]